MESLEIQKQYLSTLQKIKEKDVEVLLKKAYRGIWETAIKKYSDSAHFIYELLQNADDAQANLVEFIIEDNGLWFKHNGKTRFSISNPSTEDPDSESGNLGHINAITSIGNTTKIDEHKIGKFGIGFKAVFAYSQTPYIYDGNFNFKLENYIVPSAIQPNNELRSEGETLFYFPFNHGEKKKEDAYNEIETKLETLFQPVLFLAHLERIKWKSNTKHGVYYKKSIKKEQFNNISAELIEVSNIENSIENKEEIWLFSRNGSSEIDKVNHKLSVGFFVLDQRKLEIGFQYEAFCFFRTKEETKLGFVIQAPFKLTDNREGIKSGEPWNEEKIAQLAELAAESLPIIKQIGINENTFLLNDSILELIPFKEESVANSKSGISFRPFYTAILKKLKSDQLLPGQNETYYSSPKAYWASDPNLVDLFSDVQISDLMTNPNSGWVFVSKGQKQLNQANKPLEAYINSLVSEVLDPKKLLRRVTPKFTEQQTDEWLIKFYIYLLGHQSLWNDYENLGKKKPILLNQDRRAVIPYNESLTSAYIFLPTENPTTHNTIYQPFVENEKVLDFLKSLGIDKPKLKDEIEKKIIPLYKNNFDYSNIEKIMRDFEMLLKYFQECPKPNQPEYIAKLKEIKFIRCKNNGASDDYFFCLPENCYYPSTDLNIFFETKPETLFVDLKFYESFLKAELLKDLKPFLVELGVNELPLIVSTNLGYADDVKRIFGITILPYSQLSNTHYAKQQVIDKSVDGCFEILKNLTPERSAHLWKVLRALIAKFGWNNGSSRFIELLEGVYKYVAFRQQYYSSKPFKSSEFQRLTTMKWLVNKNEIFVSPSETSVTDLADFYDVKNFESRNLIEYLGIKNPDKNLYLTDDQRNALNIGRRILAEGITQADIDNIIAERKRVALKPTAAPLNTSLGNEATDSGEDTNIPLRKRNASDDIPKPFLPESALPAPETEPEEDEYNPIPVTIDPVAEKKNFDQTEKKKEQEYQDEKELRLRRAEYLDIAQKSEMYSFGWFKALLELEDSFTTEDRVKRNPIRVVFNKARIEDDGTLLLYDTPYIPPSIEDVGELRITFYSGSDDENIKAVQAEVVSPQKDRVKAKLVKTDALTGFDLSVITKAVVEVSNADFILEKLKAAFKQLPYNDDDNLHRLLPQSLNFIFGPPGTGKTTYLAWLIGGLNPYLLTLAGEPILPLMDSNNKVLVLTPTNKASDVLTEKIIENYLKSRQYPEWLMRFGETKSDIIMDSNFFIKNKKVDASIYNKCTLITTIARFPYDKFTVDRTIKEADKWPVKSFKWDYIIFDEASMISLANIVYVIYQATKVNPDVKFIIGGDPFQIHPIIQFNWEGWSYISEKALNSDGTPKLNDEGKQIEYTQDAGNIYSMVGLIDDNSFINPRTTPHVFPVHNLIKQYRSIEPIGALFSNYRYNGKLQHDRIPENIFADKKKDVKKIEVHNLPLKPITFIHFPVKKYESLYRPRSIKGSPYQIYSAIFIVEALKYIQSNAIIDDNANYKIGVICPFKIQESIINKLVEKICNGKIEIVTGTVHGFQGDQCDMIITVFNPPTKITKGTRSFLNKKNILNVAISRAKDCMIILVPESKDGDIKIEDLHQIERIKSLARWLPDTKEHIIEYRAEELEQTLFKNGEKIKDFVIPYTHQNVNVYTPSKTKYEVRIDENAIDIKLE